MVALVLQYINIHLQLLACLVVGFALYLSPFYAKQKQKIPQMEKVVLDEENPYKKAKLNPSAVEGPTEYDKEIARLTRLQQEAVRDAKKQGLLSKRIRSLTTSKK